MNPGNAGAAFVAIQAMRRSKESEEGIGCLGLLITFSVAAIVFVAGLCALKVIDYYSIHWPPEVEAVTVEEVEQASEWWSVRDFFDHYRAKSYAYERTLEALEGRSIVTARKFWSSDEIAERINAALKNCGYRYERIINERRYLCRKEASE